MNKSDYDIIIIGGGPAGISAALYAVRGGARVVVIDGGASALLRAERIDNYYGAALSGAQLYERGLEQAQKLGADVIKARVGFVRHDGDKFIVSAERDYTARALIVATGAERKKPNIEGVAEYEGKGVSYCAVCDAFFYKKKRVGVIGAGEFAEHEYNALKPIAARAVLLTNGENPSFRADEVYTKKIERIVGGANGRASGVVLSDGTRVELDGVFIALGSLGGGAIAKSLGVLADKTGEIKTDADGRTNFDFLYAAGDCTVGIKQVARAVQSGMAAGLSALADLKRKEKEKQK